MGNRAARMDCFFALSKHKFCAMVSARRRKAYVIATHLIPVVIAYPADNVGLALLQLLEFLIGVTCEIYYTFPGASLHGITVAVLSIPEPIIGIIPKLDMLPSLVLIPKGIETR